MSHQFPSVTLDSLSMVSSIVSGVDKGVVIPGRAEFIDRLSNFFAESIAQSGECILVEK